MNKLKVSKENIEVVSSFVSDVVGKYADDYRFEGAYVVVLGDEDNNLTHVGLHLVYIDYTFKSEPFAEEVMDAYSKSGILMSVFSHPYWKYNDDRENPYIKSLMMGDIVFDKGNLSETKRLAVLSRTEDEVLKMKEYALEKPIQYVKRM